VTGDIHCLVQHANYQYLVVGLFENDQVSVRSCFEKPCFANIQWLDACHAIDDF
jgi:hypothetical protein